MGNKLVAAMTARGAIYEQAFVKSEAGSWRELPTIYSAFLPGGTPDNVIRADPIHANGIGAPWHPTGFGLGSRFL